MDLDTEVTFKVHASLKTFPVAARWTVFPPNFVNNTIISSSTQIVVLPCSHKKTKKITTSPTNRIIDKVILSFCNIKDIGAIQHLYLLYFIYCKNQISIHMTSNTHTSSRLIDSNASTFRKKSYFPFANTRKFYL